MATNTVTPKKIRVAGMKLGLTGLALAVLFLFLIPMFYGVVTSLKTDNQLSMIDAPWWPAAEGIFNYEGKDYEIFSVPMPDGEVRELALYKKGRQVSEFVDPQNPEAGPFEWEGAWRQLERVWSFSPQWSNFVEAWDTVNFPRLLWNTFVYAGITTFGAVFSSALVAYGFSRFRIPGKGVLFMLMLSTVILPSAVTLIPTYFVFLKLGWVGTWLPLIIPAFFSWGTNTFLLRQFFMSIPRELDEAAMIDGASPFRVFVSIILPTSMPALTAVALFHFFWAWNDFFGPLIYLAGNPDKFPITVGLTAFNNLYSQSTNLIQAASLISAVIPVIVFFLAQRQFMQGIVVTGVEK
ncbi:MAG: carbohydrate ABC transporter permease [Anaerolineae bacterium]|jgi:multiple sugar transport system permease protein|nr:carbohydrate ABC transporter permease [Anaerolineae bacterium]MBT3711737.1 carbohydrate ABC transporter permease [Anaerolineae bacterium]MBT4312624.1 carbohydrate ABC transporter permease [Anaerolineae bacterium]MBT4459801.1 carbohydrate ABC transporter permease [Anaerolineae bacterium]MBT6059708.1 carbohydrate ABC transporter permease [Anaerolineae bacterium]